MSTSHAFTPPKLVALDVDGTLLDEHHRVSPRTADAITELRRRNIVVAIATGRPIEVIGEPGDHADWLIGSNGATVVHATTGHVLVDRAVPIDEARALAATIRATVDGVGFSIISDLEAVHEPGFERVVPPNMNIGRRVLDALSADGARGDRVRSWAAFHEHISVAEVARRIDAVIGPRYEARWMGFGAAEISEPNIDKATALQSLVDHLGFGAEHVWAFGDGANDHGMLAWAGRGHAMGNAAPETKAVAHVVVPSNHEHGVAATIEELLTKF